MRRYVGSEDRGRLSGSQCECSAETGSPNWGLGQQINAGAVWGSDLDGQTTFYAHLKRLLNILYTQLLAPLSLLCTCCLSVAVLEGTASAATLQVESRTTCLEPNTLEHRLSGVLKSYQVGAKSLVTVVANPGQHGATVAILRVITLNGEIVLERLFKLERPDCPSGVDLLAAVLDSFLHDFPRAGWDENPSPRVLAPIVQMPDHVMVDRDVSQFAGLAFAALGTRLAPVGGDTEFGIALDAGSLQHSLTASATVRIGYPHALAGGHFFESFGMLGVGWRYASQGWLVRGEVRTGGLLVFGVGYSTSHHNWLLWLEGQVTLLWQWHDVLVGPQVGISPLMHRVTADGEQSRIAGARLGLVVAVPFWNRKM